MWFVKSFNMVIFVLPSFILFCSIHIVHKIFVKLDDYKCRFCWCFVRFALEVYCWLQYLHGNQTPSCTALLVFSPFDSIMHCPFVSSKMFFWWCLMIALPTRIFDFFMWCPFMSRKISLWSCLMVALSARIFESFMYCPFVLSKTSYWYCSIAA